MQSFEYAQEQLELYLTEYKNRKNALQKFIDDHPLDDKRSIIPQIKVYEEIIKDLETILKGAS